VSSAHYLRDMPGFAARAFRFLIGALALAFAQACFAQDATPRFELVVDLKVAKAMNP
jgi:hypothetical protein